MGCSRPYWTGILQKIYNSYGNGEWSWNQIHAAHPEISNSDMRRLNCSNWFIEVKTKKRGNGRTTLWKLQPDAVRICQNGFNTKPTVKKKLKN